MDIFIWVLATFVAVAPAILLFFLFVSLVRSIIRYLDRH